MEANFHYPAEYYDEDYTIGIPSRADIPFYVRHATRCGSPVLELGCGTGRILVPIAQAGLECYGLDMSRDMLAICESKVRSLQLNNVHLRYSSMDDFHYDRKFSVIYIPFRSFQHLMKVEQQLSCLQLVRDHLNEDGVFILDVFAPNIDRLARYSSKKEGWEKEFSRKNAETESTITRYFQARANLGEQTLAVTMKWEERDPGGQLIGRKEGDFRLRYCFRFEMEHLLYRCGFIPQIFGDF
ncbi:MAG TPA: class I SAM-dependent methyltransferase, partial [Acidobacteriota bacterium]|nr:class I SAM-dependent methyltransferase [Acidobacteriota bacterium]